MLLVYLPLGNWFGVVLVLCLLRWEVLVFAWLEVLVEALKESRLYRKTPAHLARQGLQGGPRFVLEIGRGLGIHWVRILVFLVPSF